MREIKFRAWWRGGMHECGILRSGKADIYVTGGPMPGHNHIKNGEAEIMQYTGMKDSEGNEIFDGDKVEVYGEEDFDNDVMSLDAPWTFRGVVKMDSYMWMVCDPKDKTFICLWEILQSDLSIKITGNIHENPELLDAKA